MEVKLEKLKNNYKEKRKKSAINNYYSKEMNNGKSSKASLFDSIFFRVVLFIIIFLLVSIFINNLIIGLVLTSIGMFYINRFFKDLKSKKSAKKIQLVKEDLKSKRLRRELSQLNREEFIDYSKNFLEKHFDTELDYGQDGIDLKGSINNKEYAMKCVKSTMEDKVLLKKSREFSTFINNLGFEEGIMVTNGAFQKDEEDSLAILFIDFLGIKKILKDINEYPKDEDMDEYIIQRYESRKAQLRKDFKDITIGKIVKLYLIFVTFYSLSYFVSFSLYYKIAGIVAFVIATVLAGIKITDYIKVQDFT